MQRRTISWKVSILIDVPRTEVWDFTQNYDHRMQWEKSVLEVKVIQAIPPREVMLKIKGNATMTFVYKLDNRPNKTTLAIKKIHSPLIEGGGGSWSYEERDGKTLWTQHNTLVFKNKIVVVLLLPLYRWMLKLQTATAMRNVKKILEGKK
jgi:hypothetical protein